MADKVRLTLFPHRKIVEVPRGLTLLEAFQKQGILVGGVCGGRGKCGKCKVRLAEEATGPTPLERELLPADELGDGWRLACQTRLTHDLSVFTPAVPLKLVDPEVLEPRLAAGAEPVIREVLIQLPKGAAKHGQSFLDMVKGELGQRGVASDRLRLKALRSLDAESLKEGATLTCLLQGDELCDLQSAPASSRFGLALDIGTTTVSLALLDLQTRAALNVVTRLNPQADFGADVISRITHASRSQESRAELTGVLVRAVNEMIEELLRGEDRAVGDVLLMVVVGNPVMHHLFLGLDVRSMGYLPFSPVAAGQVEVRAGELGLILEPDCAVVCLPLICGYVGADTVGVILALNMLERTATTLAIDIGTNGEIALFHQGQLYTCSTAAGPAFEGAQIRSGMQARRGAIVKVAIDEVAEELRLSTVEDASAVGLAGTGLIDAVAELLRVGVLHPSGRFQDVSLWPPFLRDREVRLEGQIGFRLSKAAEAGAVSLLQGDVRQLQTAKAAIATGVIMLLKEAGVEVGEVEDILVAGAFGSYLEAESVLAIGLLPPSFPKERVAPVGNAALGGAILACLSASSLAVARDIRERVRHVELSMDPSFQDEFVSQMLFPRDES